MPLSIPAKESLFGSSEAQYPSLVTAWDYSSDKLNRVADALAQALAQSSHPEAAIFLAGSYGRMEAGEPSDGDTLIVYRSAPPAHEKEALLKRVVRILEDNGVRGSNPRGVFRIQFALDTLVDTTGSHEENAASLAQRMLLLMEARCVHGFEFGAQVISRLLDHYFLYQQHDPSKELVFLLNDCIRYFRHICVNYQFTFANENEHWALRNIKLRHSRVIMYMGLLLIILNSSSKQYSTARRPYIEGELAHTPLARISRVLTEIDEKPRLARILACYNRFVAAVADPMTRGRLQLDYEQRHDHKDYKELKDNSDLLARDLADAVYEQRHRTWSPEVFEYLLL